MTKISIKHGLEVVDSQPYGNLNGVLRSWSAIEEQSRRPQTACHPIRSLETSAA